MNLLNSFRSEWILLNRPKMWTVMGLTTAIFTILATALTLSTAKDVVGGGDNVGLALNTLVGSGGATVAVIFAIGFSSILVLAAFASSTGNEFSRGTLRAASHEAAQPVVADGRQARRPGRRRVDPDGRRVGRRRRHRSRVGADRGHLDDRVVRRRRVRRRGR